MEANNIGRKEFFKQIIGKTASFVSEFTNELKKPLEEVAKVTQDFLIKPLLPLEEYLGCEYKLLTSSKPPLYLFGEANKNLTAFSALCAKDKFLLTFYPQEDALVCSVCGAKHLLIRTNEKIQSDIEAVPLVIKEGQICLLSSG